MPKTWGERGEKQIRQRVSSEGCTGASSAGPVISTYLRSTGQYSTECCAQIRMTESDGGRINEKPSQAPPAPTTGRAEFLFPQLCTIKIPLDFNIPLLRPVCLSSGPKPHLHLKTTTKRGTFQQSRAELLAARGTQPPRRRWKASEEISLQTVSFMERAVFQAEISLPFSKGESDIGAEHLHLVFVSKERILGLIVLTKVQLQETSLCLDLDLRQVLRTVLKSDTELTWVPNPSPFQAWYHW